VRDSEEKATAEIPLRIDTPKDSQSGPTIILAHGAGAGMDSPFMQAVAESLAAGSLRVVRFEFQYMQERGTSYSRFRPDPTKVLEETWLRAIAQVGRAEDLVIGGKSLGGRIASMLADKIGARGLVCLGYPFHPVGKPDWLRVAHLEKLKTKALILQGARDTFGNKTEIARYTLSPAIKLVFLEDGDHSFKPRKSSGRTNAQNFQEAVKEIITFCRSL
jgi:hypothetical protein